MKLSELSDKILEELGSILHKVDEENAERLVEGILSSDQIFLVGMGRSGLVGRSFAMRLMQMGLPVYVVGDVTTPAIGKGDLLIAISGSGETRITHQMISAAKSFGARVFLLTARTTSKIRDISDLVLVLPDSPQPILPLRSAFESAAHTFLDAIVILIMEKTGVTQQEMMKRHSNLE
jgi:6-phospho-3-hexuloisomerase